MGARAKIKREQSPINVYSRVKEALLPSDQYSLLPAQGVATIRRTLQYPYSHLLVSPADLLILIERNKDVKVTELIRDFDDAAEADQIHIQPELKESYRPPSNKVEQTLTDIWRKLFGIKKIGIDDNFFLLGGDSLLAIQMINKLAVEFQDDTLSLQDVFQFPTIAGLAELVKTD